MTHKRSPRLLRMPTARRSKIKNKFHSTINATANGLPAKDRIIAMVESNSIFVDVREKVVRAQNLREQPHLSYLDWIQE